MRFYAFSIAKALPTGAAVVIACCLMSSCEGVNGLSEEQIAYNACVSPRNNTFVTLPGHKALVVGISQSGNKCFWEWDADSTQRALADELNACRKDFDRCFVYSTDEGDEPWVARLSGNSGPPISSFGNGGGNYVRSDGGGQESISPYLNHVPTSIYPAAAPGYPGSTPAYSSPGQTYGTPGYGLPAPSYGAPGYGSPGQTYGTPGYGPPAPSYGAQGYGSPSSPYGASAPVVCQNDLRGRRPGVSLEGVRGGGPPGSCLQWAK
jgi:hypothetical protein